MPRDALGIPLFVYYPALAFILLAIALAIIPRVGIRRLFIQGLFFGVMLSFIFAVVMHALGCFHYVCQGPFTLLGSPIWLNLAWAPAVMVFLYFRPPLRHGLLFWGYTAAFSLLSAMLNEALARAGLLVQAHWSSMGRLFVAALWFYGAALFDERYAAWLALASPPLPQPNADT